MTGNSIQQFDFNSQQVRVLADKQGEPWFVAKDVCDILELGNVSQAVSKLDDDEKSNITNNDIAQNGGKAPLIVSEAGLYSLVLKSRKPEAREFKRWVTHEVLPSIRKHGAYMTEQALEQALTSPDFLIKLANQLKDEQAKRIEAEHKQHEAEAQVRQLEPKAQLMDDFISLDATYSVGESAKLLYNAGFHIGPQQLFAVLADLGWIFKREGKWQPKQQRINSGHMALKPYTTEGKHADGSTFKFQPQVRLTGKGIMLLQWTITQRAMQQTLKRANQTPAQEQPLEA